MITGAGGFLGTKLLNILSQRYDTIGFYHKRSPHLDITNEKMVEEVFERTNPNVLINAAGMTEVDECETNKEKAWAVNAHSLSILSSICNKFRCRLIQISTDFVFDGKKGDYTELDEPNPINTYGLTKYKAEQIILKLSEDFLICRVAILYGYNGNKSERSFVNWVYTSLKENKKIKVVDDQIGTPTLIDDVAYALERLISLNCRGIYHVAGSQKLSRFDMAKLLAEEFDLNQRLITRIKSESLKQKAKRPLDTSLLIIKLEKIGVSMHSFTEGIKIMKGLIR